MQTGELTVTGKGETEITLRGWPRDVIVCFKPLPDPIPCDPHHHHDDDQEHHGHHGHHGRPDSTDNLHYKIEHEDVRHHQHGHHHTERIFFLEITWKVEGVREIIWYVVY